MNKLSLSACLEGKHNEELNVALCEWFLVVARELAYMSKATQKPSADSMKVNYPKEGGR